MTSKKTSEEKDINIFESELVPKHELLSDEERERLLHALNVHPRQLPRMRTTDAAVKAIGAKKGDIVRISRRDSVVGEYYYYRVVA